MISSISLQSDPYVRVIAADSIKGRTEVVNNSKLWVNYSPTTVLNSE